MRKQSAMHRDKWHIIEQYDLLMNWNYEKGSGNERHTEGKDS